MAYQALYRVWRSQTFDDVIGQQHITKTLQNAIEQKKISHAYLFSGPPGIGKSAFAVELAKTLQCERQGSEACDHCEHCIKFRSLQHPNLSLIFALPVGKNEESGDTPLEKLTQEDIANIQRQIKEKAENLYHSIRIPRANFIKVNSVRDVRKSSALKAYSSQGTRVFVIINADEMNDESANALLKTLEEPNKGLTFILTTPYPERILPTIISRCQHVRFGPLNDDDITAYLRTKHHVDEPRARVIAGKANGNLSHALDLIEEEIFEQRNLAVEFLRVVLYKSKKEINELIDQLVEHHDRQTLEGFLLQVETWLRDSMAIGAGHDTIPNADDAVSLRRFVTHHRTISYKKIFSATEKAVSLLTKNVYIPLILFNLAFSLRRAILEVPEHNEVKQDSR